MVYMERKRLREIEEREAAGESLWTEAIPHSARVMIAARWRVAIERLGTSQADQVERIICMLMEHGAGVQDPIYDADDWLQIENTDLSLSYLEAAMQAIDGVGAVAEAAAIQDRVNVVFNAHRVAFRFIEHQAIPLSSDELHAEVVQPVLRLLVDTRFKAAHDAYLKALKEISNGDAGDAITDAATALQEALTALGCQGNALGPLWKDAKNKGLVVSHDQNLLDGISKFVDWASADRSTTGDAHKHAEAKLEDAWLMVHVVGALIVRLAGKPRGEGDN